jgi:hypothetical protein
MKLTTLTAAIAVLFVFAQSAQAREHHHYRHHRHMAQQADTFSAPPLGFWGPQAAGFSGPQAAAGHVGGRPAAWCGWEMRQLVSSDPGPSFNLARNWTHWGHSGPVGVGAVVVWPHHVGKIVGQQDGQWIVQSGNDGHAVRTRPRSIAGVIAVRWG